MSTPPRRYSVSSLLRRAVKHNSLHCTFSLIFIFRIIVCVRPCFFMRELLTRQSVSRHVDSHVCRDRWSKVRPTRMPYISVDGEPNFVAGIDVGHGAVHVCMLCQAMYIVWMGHGALASGFGGNFPGGDVLGVWVRVRKKKRLRRASYITSSLATHC